MHRPPKATWFAILLLLPALAAAIPPQADPEAAAIRATIALYFEGDVERNVEPLRTAFHPSAILQTATTTGELGVLRQPEWHKRIRETPHRERPVPRILQIDRTGNAAMAKTQLEFSDGTFTDYLSLLKLEGRWRIVNKTYHWEAK